MRRNTCSCNKSIKKQLNKEKKMRRNGILMSRPWKDRSVSIKETLKVWGEKLKIWGKYGFKKNSIMSRRWKC